jgi:H+/Cl- antiporter ClcA
MRDRNLQTGIAILGFGLGASQVGISAATYLIPQQQPPKPISLFFGNHLHPFTQSLLLSLIFAIIGGFAGWGFSNVFQAIAGRKLKNIQASSNQLNTLSGSHQSLPQGQKQEP